MIDRSAETSITLVDPVPQMLNALRDALPIIEAHTPPQSTAGTMVSLRTKVREAIRVAESLDWAKRKLAARSSKDVVRAALREAREYILDNGSERTMAPLIQRIDDAIQVTWQPSETSPTLPRVVVEASAALEDLAYYNGAKQALAMASQSMKAAEEWLAGGCGNRVAPARATLKASEPHLHWPACASHNGKPCDCNWEELAAQKTSGECVWTRMPDDPDPLSLMRVQYKAGCRDDSIARGRYAYYPDNCPHCEKPVRVEPAVPREASLCDDPYCNLQRDHEGDHDDTPKDAGTEREESSL